jgi:hypothetical protein
LNSELNVSISTAFCAQNLDLRSKHIARVRVRVLVKVAQVVLAELRSGVQTIGLSFYPP